MARLFSGMAILLLMFFAVSNVWAQVLWNGAAPTGLINGDIVTISSGASGTLIVPNNATVTIVSDGAVTNANTATITINIGTGGKAIWEAEYSASTTNNHGVTISGTGTFEVVNGRISKTTTGTGNAINSTTTSTIIVSGGLVIANNVLAINSSGTVNITGGLVIAQGTAVVGTAAADNVVNKISNLETMGGLAVVYPASGTFTINSKAGLATLPADASVVWAMEGDEIGIKYGVDKFFPTSGSYTFREPTELAWNSSTPPAVVNGDIVTISSGASGILSVSNNATVTIVSDGAVTNANQITINTNSNGKAIWEADYSINTTSTGVTISGTGTFEVADGRISKTGTTSGIAISSATASTIIVSGGLVSANAGLAISSTNMSSVVNITGGLVAAQGTAVVGTAAADNVVNKISNQTTMGGLTVAYSLPGAFLINSKSGLETLPADASVVWAKDGDVTGIKYGVDKFFAISGSYTSRDPGTLNWNANGNTLTLIDGDKVTISSGASGILSVPNNATVTIISNGAVTNANTITINTNTSGKTIWEAEYSTGTSTGVTINGTGTFEVANGRISKTGTTSGNAISSSSTSTIIVSGGLVSANATLAINSTGTVNITGGLVVAQGTAVVGTASANVVNKISNQETMGGLVVAYPSSGTYAINSKDGLVTLPTDASVAWAKESDVTGIKYGGDKFFATSGSIVREPTELTWSGAAPAVIDGDIVVISSGASGTLSVPNNSTVTIVSNDAVTNGNTIIINTNSNGNAIWEAEYSTGTTSIGVTINGTGTFEVANGRISKTGTTSGNAINSTTASTIIVSGGLVSANAGLAINSTGTVNITGGLVVAQGTAVVGNALANVVNKISNQETMGGLVVAYPSSGTYAINSKDDLMTLPADAQVAWAKEGDVIGIKYGVDKFFATNGTQTFREPTTLNWNNNNPQAVVNGDIIVISSGAAGTLSVPNNATVTIVSDGDVTNGNAITINTNSNGKAIWEAEYSTSTTNNHGVSISGTGTFEVAKGHISKTTTGTGTSLFSNTASTIIVSGGLVIANNVLAINSTSAFSVVNITGGLVIAQGTAVVGGTAADNVVNKISNQTTMGGLAIAYPASGTYAINSKDGLMTLPADASVAWAKEGDVIGIKYGVDKFFATNGTQTLREPITLDWNNNNPQAVVNGDIIVISSGATGALSVPNNATVTIVSDGDVTNGNAIVINTNTSGKVIWEAEYEFYINMGFASAAVSITGTGTFEVADGRISRTAVYDIGAGNAITTQFATIIVSGGLISSNVTLAIGSISNGTINITGGLVIAQGTAVFGASTTNNNVVNKISNLETMGGLAVAYPSSGTYAINSKDGLVTLPADAQVAWAKQGDKIGIKYDGDKFFAISGTQTLREPATFVWSSSTAPTGLINGDIVRISSGASGTLSVPNGVTVTIVSDGAVTNTNTSGITINTNTSGKVIWEAEYSTNTTNNHGVSISGTGTFEVAKGHISKTITGTGNAINSATASTIIVSGGLVIANNALAISSTGTGTVNITGGLVAAQGTAVIGGTATNVVNKISNQETMGGLAVAYPASGKFEINSKDGLETLPADAQVAWAKQGNLTGIKYDGDKFFAISGVTLTQPEFVFDVTVAAGATFRIPLSGNDGNSGTLYNWNIDWGDGQTTTATNANGGVAVSQASAGIPHTYATAGTYTITITPNGSTDAWLRAFGFYSNTDGANVATNKAMVTKVISPLTPLMTRTQTEIANNVAVDNEWRGTFFGCVNLTMGNDFTFAQEWENITKVGDYFASNMFQNITGPNFTMNSVFNLPQGITTVGIYFAYNMFRGVTSASFIMNSEFNLPKDITTVGAQFAYGMFQNVNGPNFTMNSKFNLPQGITTVGAQFARAMFLQVTGASFTMNSVFNLPQGITTVDNEFAYSMFQGANHANFKINEVFKFPELNQTNIDKSLVFYRTFYDLNTNIANQQSRTIESIVNGNLIPNTNRQTFGTSNNTFIDRLYAPTNWGGDNGTAMTMQTQPAANTTIAYGEEASLSVVAPNLPTITYQWYKNAANSNSGGTAIDGATSATLNIASSNAGTYYYYCVASGASWGNSLSTPSNVATVKVNPKALAIETATHTKIYDGTTTATEVTVTLALAGKFSEDHEVTPNIVTAAYQSKNVGALLNISEVTLQGADAENYVVAPANGFSVAGITQLQLVVSEFDVETSKVYDGTTTAQATVISSNKIASDTDLEIAATATFNSKDVADATEITVVYSMTGDNGNYAKPQDYTTEGTITAKALTITDATATNRTYNASTAIEINAENAALVGVLNNEVTLDKENVTGSVENADVSEAAKTVTVAGFALTGNELGNYSLTQPADLEVIISKATLANFTVAKGLAEGKVYDGTAGITVGIPTIATTDNIFGQAVGINANFAFNNANAGENKSIVATVTGLTNTNFELAEILDVTPTSTDLAITAKQLTIANPTVTLSKVYDGNNVATATAGTLENVVGGDLVNVSIVTATFNSANVTEANLITVVYSVDNANYAKPENYTIAGTITKAIPEVLEFPTATSITYGQAVSASTLSGGTAGGMWAWANASEKLGAGAHTVAVAFNPTDDENYDWSHLGIENQSVSITVAKASLTITGVTATNRDYNNTKTVVLSGGTLNGVIAGDEVNFVLGTGTMADASAEQSKAVTTNIALGGTASSNYSLTQPTGLEVTISPALLTNFMVNASSAEGKVYDGTAEIITGTLTITTTDNIFGQAVGINANFAFNDKNAGENKSIVATVTGLTNENFALAEILDVTSASTDLAITAKALSITGATATNRTYNASTAIEINAEDAELVGVFNGEVSLNKESVTGSVVNADASETAKAVTVAGFALTGNELGNYTLAQPTDLEVTISPALLANFTVAKGTAEGKVYDGTANITGTPTIATTDETFGQAVGINANFAFNNANAGENKSIVAMVTGLTNENFALAEILDVTPASTDLAITAKQLTIANPAVTTAKTYDGNDLAAATAGELAGILGGDLVNVEIASATYNTKDVATANLITVAYSVDNTNYTKPENYTIAGTINAKALTIANPAVTTAKAYDGNDLAAATAGELAGILGGDLVNVEIATATYNTKDVATANLITVAYSIDNANYTKPVNYTIAGTITAKALTIANPTVTLSKVYDGNDLATATAGALENVVGGDLVNVSIATATYNSKDVADANLITVAYSIDNANYTKPVNYTTAGTITAKQLTIANPTVTASKVYDGNNLATATAGALGNVVGGDLVNVEIASATYNSKDVTIANLITVAYSIDNGNYVKPQDYTTAGTITAKQLTIANPTVTTAKTYDGNNVAIATAGELAGILGGDLVNVEIATATYNTKDVATANLITVAYSVDNTNYTKPENYTIAGTITAKQLTIASPAVTATKTYNGNNVATATAGELENAIDDVEVIATATYNSKDVAIANLITVVYSIDNANYTKPVNYTTAGTITAKQLTIANPTVTTAKTYDGNNVATATAGELENVIDDVEVIATATYNSKDVADANLITVTYSIDNANYTKPQDYTTAGTITAKQLTIASPTVTATKTYDGNNVATATAGALENAIDDVEVIATATYNSKDVADATEITVVYSIDNANYTKPQDYTTAGTITAKVLTITDVTATDRTYNGTETVALVGGTLNDVIAGETSNVTFILGEGTIANANAEQSKAVTTNIALGGTASSNYSLTQPTDLQVTISKAMLTNFTVAKGSVEDKEYDGTADITAGIPTITTTDETFGQTVEINANFAFNNANAGENKSIVATVTGLTNPNFVLAENPVVTPASTNIVINPQQLASVNISATTKAYDGTELTPIVTSGAEVLVKGKDYTITFTGTNGTNAGNGTFTLTGIGNYAGTIEASFTIDHPIAVTPKPLTITANNITVTYGDNAPAYTVTYEGFVDGDNEFDLIGELKFTSSYNSNSKVGNYAIVPSGLSSEKYNISFVSGTISVLPAEGTIQITLKETGTAEDIDFEINEELNSNNKFFIKANTNCKIDKADLQIPYDNGDSFRAEVKLNGIDTVFTAERKDTIIIISPIPYEKLIRQKWGMLIINNNPQTNGGYKFTEFNWKIGGEELHNNNLQYYRASDFGEKLHPEIPVKVQLKTKEGLEISTCEGNPMEIEASPEPISAKKQVLGLDNKNPAANAKIYNIKGKRVTGNKIPAGVYIVEEGKNNQNEVNK